jgi:hypothetical protein
METVLPCPHIPGPLLVHHIGDFDRQLADHTVLSTIDLLKTPLNLGSPGGRPQNSSHHTPWII